MVAARAPFAKSNVAQTSPATICRANIAATQGNEMSTEPDEKSEKKFKIERVPEAMFGGTRERINVVADDEAVSKDTSDEGSRQNAISIDE
jgi:hypothetical protein